MSAHYSEATRWRFALAERIGTAYASDANAQVVMIAGSVGRGRADHFSDIEIDVYYESPPTENARRAAVERCGATLHLLDEDDDEWEEQMVIGGFHIATSTFLVSTMERYLHEVLDECQVSPLAQVRLHSLLHSVPLKGHTLVEGWRARARRYPDGLVHAMLAANLPFHGFWYAEEMLAARDDLLLLYDIVVRVEQQMLGALLGLNRLYMPVPGTIKGMDEIISEMSVKPERFSERLKMAFRIEPADAVAELKTLIQEILLLVEQQAPAFDTAPYRGNLARRRDVWHFPPGGLGLEQHP